MKTDPTAALEAAETAQKMAELRIGDLRIQRASVIESATGDYASQVAKLDNEIAAMANVAEAHRERIIHIGHQIEAAAQQQRDAAKKAAIAGISKLVATRQSSAERLDTVLKQLLQALEAFDAAESALFSGWPDVLPPAHKLGYLRLHIDALSPARKQRMSAGLIRELAGHVPYGLATMTAERNSELIAELESAPIPEVFESEAA